ncbi:MAG: hypothetical protein A3J46_01895 [Candidatus Yanofskybacteria bacterium RIFCSPHIGHO2_02_FULL_41_11]|uniref:3-deoxy-D-manno-octulosonate 8-phosphate phosphatase n=1 Tax=Candidatus Yanofskybacteria bacterium RIFCSPHIGHO2_02_FULL_41_11 TaxID=1802675 RepID=A0A1F8F794_9BACT|nr:MAG: Phosphatase kdsC [Microgenomates group bacterium GW2011_GWA1_48_10]OGN08498.1 MAG: hypothetical protein A3J46_01895 [Candidatus Yanofskybacteria bacterium RIFCSPHIGHO2_02_FULL_41_11]
MVKRKTQKSKVLAQAKKIKAAGFGSLGVLFSATVWFDSEKGEVQRVRSHVDGQGISLLRGIGLRICFVTATGDNFLPKFAEKLNSLPSAKSGKWPKVDVFVQAAGEGKVKVVGNWLKKLGLAWDECAFMGDDLGDYPVMKKVGLAACPAGAEKIIKDIAHFTASREAGSGAVRDFCNLLLQAKRVDPTSLPLN